MRGNPRFGRGGLLASQRFSRTDGCDQLAGGGIVPAKVSHRGISRSLRLLARIRPRPVQMAELVQTSGLSRRGFSKAFKKHIGLRPVQALRRVRIAHAKRLLVECDLELEVIAGRCGYSSANTFWIAFRQETGLAPKRFQRQAWLMAYLNPGTALKMAAARSTRVGDSRKSNGAP